MGKASSAKKVARAAGIGGGRTARGRRPWVYYGVIVLVAGLGVLGTWTSRDNRLGQINAAGSNTPPAVGSTENAAFAVDECGKIQPNITTKKDPVGITTTGDGIIRIHPKTKAAAGKNATLGVFATSIGMKLNASELQIPGGHLYLDGDKCNGVAGHVYVRHFSYAGDQVGTLENSDPQNVHLDDGSEYTIAFVPASQRNKIPPPPPSVVHQLATLEAAAQNGSSPTSAPATRSPATRSPATSSPATKAPAPTTTKK